MFRGDFAKHVVQLEFRDHTVVQVEQQLKAIAGSLSIAEINRMSIARATWLAARAQNWTSSSE
jgi:hypothetical protein